MTPRRALEILDEIVRSEEEHYPHFEAEEALYLLEWLLSEVLDREINVIRDAPAVSVTRP